MRSIAIAAGTMALLWVTRELFGPLASFGVGTALILWAVYHLGWLNGKAAADTTPTE